MAHKQLVVAVSLIIAASPASATFSQPDPMASAPAGNADSRYCLRVEAVTGSRIETIECWTRQEWVDQGVDVDKEWAKEGVAFKE